MKERLPVDIFLQIFLKKIIDGSRRLNGLPDELHPGLFRRAGCLAMVAGDAGGYQIRPGVLSAGILGQHMVDGECAALTTAILAGIVIAPEDLMPRKLKDRAGTMDHVFETDNGRDGIRPAHSMKFPASVLDEGCFLRVDQAERSANVANMYGLEVGVQHKNGIGHTNLMVEL